MGKLVEIDLEEESTATSKADVEVLRVRRLEDAIHGIIVRRAAPDWLPFRPGSSYWVPPRPTSLGLVELVEKLANPMSEEERLSFSSVRGWPSLDYFVQGTVLKAGSWKVNLWPFFYLFVILSVNDFAKNKK